MQPDQIHVGAILVAALSMFLLGGLWYSPLLFGKAWMRLNGFSPESLRTSGQLRPLAGSAVLALIMATNLACFLADAKTTVTWGMAAGALAGGGWVATGLAMTALFERKPWAYIAINGGYHLAAFTVMGAILGAWR
jgi:hypothetical protein